MGKTVGSRRALGQPPAGAPPAVGPPRPGPSLAAAAGRGWFYRLRVTVLLLVLAGVIVYALRDRAARGARRSWQRPLEVALVLLEGSAPPRSAALGRFVERVAALEQALWREFEAYGGRFRPVRFHVFGPVRAPSAPPAPGTGPAWLESLRISWRLWRFSRASDAAAGVSGPHDGKVYALLSEPQSVRRAAVEGLGQDGGRIALTRIELSEDSVDFGLFVVAHELLHLLGARDRYGPDGLALVPEGLGDPEREPLFPQLEVEVMARGRVLEPGLEVPPGDLEELRVGSRTAREIGWLEADPPP